MFRTAVLRKLFDIRFSYKHCNFSHVCLLVKMALKTLTRSISIHQHIKYVSYLKQKNKGGKKLLNRSGKGMSLSKDIFFTNRSQKLQNGQKLVHGFIPVVRKSFH